MVATLTVIPSLRKVLHCIIPRTQLTVLDTIPIVFFLNPHQGFVTKEAVAMWFLIYPAQPVVKDLERIIGMKRIRQLVLEEVLSDMVQWSQYVGN